MSLHVFVVPFFGKNFVRVFNRPIHVYIVNDRFIIMKDEQDQINIREAMTLALTAFVLGSLFKLGYWKEYSYKLAMKVLNQYIDHRWIIFIFMTSYFGTFFIGPFVFKKLSITSKGFFTIYNASMATLYLAVNDLNKIGLCGTLIMPSILLSALLIAFLLSQTALHSICIILLVYLSILLNSQT